MENIEQHAEQLIEAQGDLSEQDQFNLLTGAFDGQGETAGESADTGAPDAGSETEQKTEQAPAGSSESEDGGEPAGEKVILAKDGVHTIEYQKLVDAREAAKAASAAAAAAQAETERLRAELAAAKATPTQAQATGEEGQAGAEQLFGDYSEEALKAGVQKLVAQALAEAPATKAAETNAAKDHYTAIYTAHPDADSIVQSQEFEAWKASQPSFARAAFDNVQANGSAEQVVEMLGAYRAAHPAKAAAPAPSGPNARALANAALDKVKPRTPQTLSDIPAGSAAHHDESEAVMDMNANDLLGKFEGLSPEKIEKLLLKAL
jgi:hypothetical protein